MSQAVLCPVCNGDGEIPDKLMGFNTSASARQAMKPCHGCGGRGWIEVDKDKEVK